MGIAIVDVAHRVISYFCIFFLTFISKIGFDYGIYKFLKEISMFLFFYNWGVKR